jgi:hypothetical protein
MGIFSKERHGVLECVEKGFQYIWKIPKIKSYTKAILDSPIAQCGHTGVDFHFHMTIDPEGHISFYMHYKDVPIPKYTYSIGCATGMLPRQHTAFRIPQTTERCGHCNVINMSEIHRLLGAAADDTLFVFFQWDKDTTRVSAVPDAELAVTWEVPSLHGCRLTPLTSKGFVLNNAVYAIRVDEVNDGEALIIFIFAKEGNIVAHSLEVYNVNRELVAELPPATESGARILRCSKKDFLSHFPPGTPMTVYVKFLRHNPLDLLNNPVAANRSLAEEPKRLVDLGGNEKGKQYVVMEDDV